MLIAQTSPGLRNDRISLQVRCPAGHDRTLPSNRWPILRAFKLIRCVYSLFFRKNYAMLGAVFAGAFAFELSVHPR